MANLGKPFKSLPLSKGSHDFASESAEGTRGLLASMAIRSAPLPGTGARATPLPELAQQIAKAEIEYPESALRRLHTYAHVKKALGSVPNLEEEKQTFIGRLATRLKTTFYGKGARRSDSRDQASAEVHLLFLDYLTKQKAIHCMHLSCCTTVLLSTNILMKIAKTITGMNA